MNKYKKKLFKLLALIFNSKNFTPLYPSTIGTKKSIIKTENIAALEFDARRRRKLMKNIE